jgi:uncharacterized membrane protein (UPF0127 family)
LCRVVREVVTDDGRTVVARCHVADGPLTRFVGLLATPDLGEDEGLWLEPCSSVHTAGMRIPIGCAFLDAEGRVLRVIDPLPAWRHAGVRGARAVVEVRAGGFAELAVGMTLTRRSAAKMSA